MTTNNEAFEAWFEISQYKYADERAKNYLKLGWHTATTETNKRIAELDSEIEHWKALANRPVTDNTQLIANMERMIAELQSSNKRLREAAENYILEGESRLSELEQALSTTPAESLTEHDNELLERAAKVCNDMLERRGVTFDHKFMADTCAEAIRALKGK